MKRKFLLCLCVFGLVLLTACDKSAQSYSSRESQYRYDEKVYCGLNISFVLNPRQASSKEFSGFADFSDNYYAGTSIDFAMTGAEESSKITFSFDDKKTSFILPLKDGSIFATGMMEESLSACEGRGGGVFAGPGKTDSGNWFAEWDRKTEQVRVEIPGPSSSSSSLPASIFFQLLALVVLLVMFVLIWKLFRPNRKTKKNTTLKKAKTESSSKSENQPFAEYTITYTNDDKFFDFSFEIAKDNQRYLGECGLTTLKGFTNKAHQTTAFELWLFEADSNQTISRTLLSEYCFQREELRALAEQKGPAALVQPKEVVMVETSQLRAVADVQSVEYDETPSHPQSIFKQMVVKLQIWRKE